MKPLAYSTVRNFKLFRLFYTFCSYTQVKTVNKVCSCSIVMLPPQNICHFVFFNCRHFDIPQKNLPLCPIWPIRQIDWPEIRHIDPLPFTARFFVNISTMFTHILLHERARGSPVATFTLCWPPSACWWVSPTRPTRWWRRSPASARTCRRRSGNICAASENGWCTKISPLPEPRPGRPLENTPWRGTQAARGWGALRGNLVKS